jgi:hypothetical protein
MHEQVHQATLPAKATLVQNFLIGSLWHSTDRFDPQTPREAPLSIGLDSLRIALLNPSQ